MKHRVFFGLAGFLGALLLAGCEQPSEQEQPPRPVLVVQPEPAHQGAGMYPGEVRARFAPELAFRVGGKVTRRLVQTGQRVRAGELLAELDPSDLQLQVQAMLAQQAEARAGLALARDELERYRKLYQSNLLSKSQLDSLQTNEKRARAWLEQAGASLEHAKNQLQYGRLLAPESGIIAQTRVEAGQVVAAGQPVFVLAADGQREVEFSIPEQAYAGFALGQPVQVSLLNRPEQRLAGEIRELAQSADPRSRTFSARVSLAGEAAVELGQSARVHVSARDDQVWLVPLSAVDGEGQQAFVWVLDAGQGLVRRQPVGMRGYDDQHVLIEQGLQGSEWVVAAGVHLLREGMQVRALDPENRPVVVGEE